MTDPLQTAQKLADAKIRFASFNGVLGYNKRALKNVLRTAASLGFPGVMPKGGLHPVEEIHVEADVEAGRYTVGTHFFDSIGAAAFESFVGNTGSCTRSAPLPPSWPGAPANAQRLCWASALDRTEAGASLKGGSKMMSAFLSVDSSPALRFAMYGGFLLLDSAGVVVTVQQPHIPNGADLDYEAPRPWRHEFSASLASRLKEVTIPFQQRGGARKSCFILPQEELSAGPELWTPSITGAWLFQMKDGTESYYPLRF